jgi:hypothetical protein
MTEQSFGLPLVRGLRALKEIALAGLLLAKTFSSGQRRGQSFQNVSANRLTQGRQSGRTSKDKYE